MPTYRGLTAYADGTPGTTDRLLFETSGNAPRGVAPASLLTPIGAEPADATILKEADVDDTPEDGATTVPISSNWAFDHAAMTAEHLDWTADQGATNIHSGNIPDLSATYQPRDAELDAWAGKTAPSGTVVGTTDTQTLSGKTIDGVILTGSVTVPDGALAIADTSGLQTALDGKIGADADGAAIVDYIQPHVAGVSGTLTQAAHGGRPVLATGAITVPVTDGFTCLIRNKSGSSQTVQPASGNLIHEGATQASISLPTNREVAVHGDGTDVWVAGALA